MGSNRFNFTKATIDRLPIPTKGKRDYWYDTKMRGLGISVTSAGTRSFISYRWINGKPERITLGRYPDLPIEKARGLAAEIGAAIARGENPQENRRLRRAEATMEGLFETYLEQHAKPYTKTWRVAKARFDRHLGPWRKRKISAISRDEIQVLHSKIGRDNGKYAANRLLQLLHSVFNRAHAWGMLPGENPAGGIKKFREKARERFLHPDELPRFFQALMAEPNTTIRDFFLVSLLTGARRGNVLALRWVEISFERATWTIPETKNGASLTLPLTPDVISILVSRIRNAQPNSRWYAL